MPLNQHKLKKRRFKTIKILKKFLDKSFSKLAPNCTVKNAEIAKVIHTAAETQDFLEETSKKQGNKPNADIIFKRIKGCDIEKLAQAFMFVLDFMFKNIKQKFNLRGYTIAIDTHYEGFYGKYTDLWVHGYIPRGLKDATGSYCYITIAAVIGKVKFTFMALPVYSGQDTAELIEQIITVAKKYVKVELALLDRGFDSGKVTRVLKELKIKYIIFAKRNDKVKRFFDETESFKHRYFNDKITWYEDKSKQEEPTKYLIFKDYVDMKSFKIYDWVFLTNLSNLKAVSYVYLYKRRWAIEDTYKQFKRFRIITTSINYIARYFFFLFRILLYNLWKFYNLMADKNMTLKEFTFTLFLASQDIDHIKACKKEMADFMKRLEKPFAKVNV